MCKEFLKFNNKQGAVLGQWDQLKSGQKTSANTSTKKVYKWQVSIWKDV